MNSLLPAYREIVEFLAAGTTPRGLVAFHPSKRAKDRVGELIEREKTTGLTAEDTGLRFHPVEIVVSMGIKLAAVAALGAPPTAVLIFEVALNGTSMFNHCNIRIPLKIDRLLRLLVVTPDMHRVHHSVIIRETNSNFGFNLPWWDRLFGTYKEQPEKGHTGI